MSGLRAALDRPKFWVWANGLAALAWVCLAVPAVWLWRNSVPFLVFISVYANFAASVASWQAARADQHSPSREDVQRVADRVVELLRRTPEREG